MLTPKVGIEICNYVKEKIDCMVYESRKYLKMLIKDKQYYCCRCAVAIEEKRIVPSTQENIEEKSHCSHVITYRLITKLKFKNGHECKICKLYPKDYIANYLD